MKRFALFLILFPTLFACGPQKSAKDINAWDNAVDTVVRKPLFDVSMKEGITCYRIPALVTATNGDLIAAIDERVPSCGDLKWSDNINIAIRRSTDNGHTWLPIETIVDFPLGQSASDPSMVVDEETGEIFMFYNYMDLIHAKNEYRFHVISSKDNGKTWSEHRDITEQLSVAEMKDDFKFITSGRANYTADGKIIHTIVNLSRGLYVFGSDNHGKDWYFIDNPVKPADESKIIDLPNGKWMINSRVNNFGFRYRHISDDMGKTWTSEVDSALTDPGCNGSIIKYSSVKNGDDKDRIVISQIADPKGRNNLTIRLSYDNGKTWAYSKSLYPLGAAYSSMTVLKDGNIAIAYEKDGYSTNEIAIFSLAWLTDGQDKGIKK